MQDMRRKETSHRRVKGEDTGIAKIVRLGGYREERPPCFSDGPKRS